MRGKPEIAAGERRGRGRAYLCAEKGKVTTFEQKLGKIEACHEFNLIAKGRKKLLALPLE